MASMFFQEAPSVAACRVFWYCCVLSFLSVF